jgi:hypothetical protein
VTKYGLRGSDECDNDDDNDGCGDGGSDVGWDVPDLSSSSCPSLLLLLFCGAAISSHTYSNLQYSYK